MSGKLLKSFGLFLLLMGLVVPFLLGGNRAYSGSNLVVNGGFEDGVIAPWTNYNSGTIVADAYAGAYAGFLPSHGSYEQVITGLSPNTEYRLRGWARLDTGSTGRVIVGVKDFGGAAVDANIDAVVYTEGDVVFTTGAADTSAKIYCFKQGGEGGAFCDEFSVAPVSAELLANWGFEDGVIAPWTNFSGGSIVTNDVRSGNYAGYLPSQGSFEQVVTGLTPGASYEVSGWAKVEGGGTGEVIVGVKDYGGAAVDAVITADVYTEGRNSFTMGSASTSATIYCFRYWGDLGAFCDDFSVTETTVDPLPTPIPSGEWTLIWSDEFGGNSLDTSKWGYELGYIRNNELQYYTDRPENVRVEGGNLVLEAREESFMGYAYTSGSIETLGNFAFQYGRVDVRAALPMDQGLWPAIWTLGENFPSVNWPYSGEIDIMEHINEEQFIYGTIHYADANNMHDSEGGGGFLADPEAFHVYSIEWDEDEIRWFIDDVAFNVIQISDAERTEFHLPHFLKLNLAVGGNWPGPPDGETVFPAQYLVDYVRVYELGVPTSVQGVGGSSSAESLPNLLPIIMIAFSALLVLAAIKIKMPNS